MKKTLLILSIITLILAGCKKFDEIEASKVEIIAENIEKGWDYIKINVEYDYPVELEAVTLYLSEKEDMSGAEAYECNVEGKKFSVEVEGLKEGVGYYCCYEYDNGYEKVKGEIQNINTISKPVVITKEVSGVNTVSATLNGSVTNNAAINKIIEMGFCWGTEPDPTVEVSHYNNGSMSGTGTSDFSYNLTSLVDNVTYYVRTYAKTNYGTVYGEEKSFTTVEIVKPTVITNNIKNITPTTGTLNGEVTFEGNAIVTAKGFCWDTSPEPTLDDNYSTNGSGIGGFTHALTDLPDNTTYYVRAYATNEKGTSYGEEKTFTTVEVVLPAVVTNDITDITTNSAKCSGTVISDGNSAILAKGICWSTSPEPTLNNNYTDEGDGSGAFISSLTNLTDGVKYYVRAYATNEKGTSYGEEKSFTTVEITLPIVTTKEVTNIGTSTATCGGNVTSEGNGIIISRGVCWSTSPNPTINDNKTTDGSGTGSYTSNLTNLSDNTTYYVRAYVTNEKGTSYGEEVSFTTLERTFENGYEYVDLGLSVKWATCNVGATTPEDYGNYYAWGETSEKETYTSDNSSTYDQQMNDISGDVQYDAATANWGGNWRMPTCDELIELRSQCTWVWTTQNDVSGYKITSPNGNYIFLPAAGCHKSSLDGAGEFGLYWTSTPAENNTLGACGLQFYSGGESMSNGFYRYLGLSVRPVIE